MVTLYQLISNNDLAARLLLSSAENHSTHFSTLESFSIVFFFGIQ